MGKFAVVPAQAGTHNHSPLRSTRRGPCLEQRRGVWVPAFAGTTKFVVLGNATKQSSLYATLDRFVVSLLAMTETKPGNGELHSRFFKKYTTFSGKKAAYRP
jgi:hypothetical protein